MDAHSGLLRLHLIEGVLGFAAFFSDGQDAKGGDGFEGIVGFWMQHADADGNVVSDVKEGRRQNERD